MSTAVLETEDVTRWKTRELSDYVGGLSNPSKMPGYGYSLPAAECRTGSKLRPVAGSTCSSCYALKGRYLFPNVSRALYKRLEAIGLEHWTAAMAELITRKTSAEIPYFRWHDAGDLQSLAHLENIARVCELTPDIRHWLPTREYQIVRAYVKKHSVFPANLNIRLSAHMIGGQAPTFKDLAGIVTVSTVSKNGLEGSHDCPSRHQGNSCGSCRACWNPAVQHVDYRFH